MKNDMNEDILNELGLSDTTSAEAQSTYEAIETFEDSPEDEEAIEATLSHPIFQVLPKTRSAQTSIKNHLRRAKMSAGLMDTLQLMLAEDVMAQERENRANREFDRRESIRSENKFKELRYRKALDAGLLDDSIRLESGREKVINVSAEKEQLQLANKKNYDLYKANRELEKEISRLKGEKDGI